MYLKESWLSYIESLHPKTIDLGLERVQRVFNVLNWNSHARIITITGTNGKGTTVATLEAIYKAAGYQVAAYTSPHLLNFNERIRINGEEVTDTLLCQAFEAVEKARQQEEGKEPISLTYFEFTTLAAFWVFAQSALDVIILEVGMGGRLDAVNIVDADVAVITNIDLDHQDWLGNSREAIAIEKLGIARSQKPLIYGETNAPAGFFEYVEKQSIPLLQITRDFTIEIDEPNQQWRWHNQKQDYQKLFLAPFIISNMGCAIQAIECLQDKLPVTQQAIEQGLKQIHLTGRCQIIAQQPWQLIDVAHNPHGSAYLANCLNRMVNKQTKGTVKAVFSALKDKDIDGIVAPLLQLVDEWHVAGLGTERGNTAEKIAAIITQKTAVPVFKYDQVTHAYQTATSQAQEGDGIVIFGSFHTVAEVLLSKSSIGNNKL
jgi:dihydrofolate synthase/folylpolyglutamate synthase